MPSLSKFCERMDYYCRIASVGYDQWERWNVYDGGETDCSALVITCLDEADFDTGEASYTGNLSENLTSRGWERLAPDLSTCIPGDILLNDSSHVAAVISGYGWDATVAQASIDENGDIHGGQAGDQTGYETNECGMYDYPWDCILRYAGGYDESGDEMFHVEDPKSGVDVYRMYLASSGEHFYTASTNERDGLRGMGWIFEGVAWKTGTPKHPVYRMIGPNGHLFTTNYEEASVLSSRGWRCEGVPFYASDDGAEIYRLWNGSNGDHLLTTDKKEVEAVKKIGYVYEGVAFRA